MNDSPTPFTQRFGLAGPTIEADFPEHSRVAVFHVVRDMVDNDLIRGWPVALAELERLARVPPQEVLPDESPDSRALHFIRSLTWVRMFEFCERVYWRLLRPAGWTDSSGNFHEEISLADIRRDYALEVNRVLAEDGFAFVFELGQFTRPGHAHHSRTAAAAHKILARPELQEARRFYSKAQHLFKAAPQADYPNAVKEAVMALEAAAKALFPWLNASDLRQIVAKLRGNGEGQIPPALAKILEQIYAFRGAAFGVTHGNAAGGKVDADVAELVLTSVAAWVIYLSNLSDKLSTEPPF